MRPDAYRDARKNFNAELEQKDPETVKQGWQNGVCEEKTRSVSSGIRPTLQNSVWPHRSNGKRPVRTQWPSALKKRDPNDGRGPWALGPNWRIPAPPPGKS
jgi:hypothetical protein